MPWWEPSNSTRDCIKSSQSLSRRIQGRHTADYASLKRRNIGLHITEARNGFSGLTVISWRWEISSWFRNDTKSFLPAYRYDSYSGISSEYHRCHAPAIWVSFWGNRNAQNWIIDHLTNTCKWYVISRLAAGDSNPPKLVLTGLRYGFVRIKIPWMRRVPSVAVIIEVMRHSSPRLVPRPSTSDPYHNDAQKARA